MFSGAVVEALRPGSWNELIVTVSGVRSLAGLIVLFAFAVAVSLVETRWLFAKLLFAARHYKSLAILDIVASLAIGLYVPLALGFGWLAWPALVLSGGDPWLGVLIWSAMGPTLMVMACMIAWLLLSHRPVQRPFSAIAYVLVAEAVIAGVAIGTIGLVTAIVR